jgi:hypothetical protein
LPSSHVKLLGSAFALGLVFFIGRSAAAADTPKGAVRLDGLAMLAGGRESDESDSIPVLVSDVEFEAALVLLRKQSSIEPDLRSDAEVWKKARRSAVLVRMLSRNAKQLGESIDPSLAETLENELIERAGGPDAMDLMLARFGVESRDLKTCAENALLAAGRLRYMEEQVDIPSDREIVERIQQDADGDPKNEQAYGKYRRLILEERLNLSIAAWLNDILAKGRVRILK